MKQWWLHFQQLPWDRRLLLYVAALSLLPLALGYGLRASTRNDESPRPGGFTDVDTQIPRGFVLVPIEVQNYEAVDSVLGKFAVVDLYQGSDSAGARQRLLARNVRMLRAPQNPSHFAVLLPEAEASGVLRFGGLFSVTLKRPLEGGTEFVKEYGQSRRSITYEGG